MISRTLSLILALPVAKPGQFRSDQDILAEHEFVREVRQFLVCWEVDE